MALLVLLSESLVFVNPLSWFFAFHRVLDRKSLSSGRFAAGACQSGGGSSILAMVVGRPEAAHI
ncbi:MAG: hypothetical protein ACK5EA_20680 [Planctomycetaceae bacterium]